ncbi:MAG: AMP-binding protein [Pararhodobacter sp.]|nr:AMP-binding protein [Pararhodobacter sp.]
MLTGDMLRRSAERFALKPALIWQDTTTSYCELDTAANRCANALLSRGLAQGSKVGIICRNRPEYAVAFFGVARSGHVLVNISVLLADEELRFVLNKADVELLLVEAAFADKVSALRERLPKLREVVVIGGEGSDFDAMLAAQNSTPPSVELHEDMPFCMTYTGGTTGLPKGVLASHRNRAITAQTVAMEEALDERDIVGIVTPMFHVAALNIMFQPAILVGATCVLMTGWDVREFAALARRTGMTAAFMVPTQVAMMIADDGFDPADYARFTKLSFAGAPMPDWVQHDVLEKLPGLRMTQIYGQSEVGVLTSLRHWYLPAKLGSIGRQAYNVDVALVDREGNPVPQGEVGEIVSRGDNVMLQYYDEPEQTAEFFRGGWAWTGDLARMDEDGFIYLIDRSKDMMISGGENIYPKEIENTLYQLPEVAECAVFGIPDDKWGEVPAAYIQLHPGAALSEDRVISHCTAMLARFKRPRLVRFVDSFPKTAMGKIQKNVLRAPYWNDEEERKK